MTVVLIGGGPSLATLDLNLLNGIRFVVVNSGCRKVLPVATSEDVLYFTDNSWSENRPQLAAGWPGPVVTSNRNTKVRLGAVVRWVDLFAMTERFAIRPDYLQASSGHIAAGLIAVMGARRIVLTAFECQAIDGRTHGHGDYNMHDLSPFTERFLPGWRALARAFDRMKVEVVNATPHSAIDCFPVMGLREALA